MRTHGIPATFKRGCRCEPCKEAGRHDAAIRREARYGARTLVEGRLVAPLPPERHGKPSTYTGWGCRCEPCTAAATDSVTAARRARRAAA